MIFTIMIKKLFRQILKEESLLDTPSKIDIKILKKIHDKKKELKTKKNITDYLEDLLKFFSISPKKALIYYYMFILNYREKGDYENIASDEFIDAKKITPLKVSNINSGSMVNSTIPFVGSNLKGAWETDRNGVDQYVVTSYDWYPIYIFKKNQWFGVTDTYSISTSKQMSHSRPDSDYVTLNRKEMERIRMGESLDDIYNTRPLIFIQKRKNDLLMKSQSLVFDTLSEGEIRVYYRIKDIEMVNEKVKFEIEVTSIKKSNSDDKLMNISNELKEDILKNFYDKILYKFGKSYELNFNQIVITVDYR